PLADVHPGKDEIQGALTALALQEGKADDALVRALEDKVSLRRAAAGTALCRAARGAAAPEARRLLQDPDPVVRLPVALALAEFKDREAFPVLIALLSELPAEQLWQAEETLRRLAGDQAPALALGTEQGSQRKCREAWETWWRDNGAKADLARLD